MNEIWIFLFFRSANNENCVYRCLGPGNARHCCVWPSSICWPSLLLAKHSNIHILAEIQIILFKIFLISGFSDKGLEMRRQTFGTLQHSSINQLNYPLMNIVKNKPNIRFCLIPNTIQNTQHMEVRFNTHNMMVICIWKLNFCPGGVLRRSELKYSIKLLELCQHSVRNHFCSALRRS